MLDILIISSTGDPTLEPPKVSLDPPPSDAEAPKIVEDINDPTEKDNLEAPPPLEQEVYNHNNILSK